MSVAPTAVHTLLTQTTSLRRVLAVSAATVVLSFSSAAAWAGDGDMVAMATELATIEGQQATAGGNNLRTTGQEMSSGTPPRDAMANYQYRQNAIDTHAADQRSASMNAHKPC